MKNRIFLLLLAASIFVPQTQGNTNGYLSFVYSKGQAQSDISGGTFHEARLGLFFSGEISNKIDFLTEIRVQEGTRVDLKQAWVAIKSSDRFNFKVGLYLVPFGNYNQFNRPHQTLLINTPLNVYYTFPERWRDIGILVEGGFSGFYYSAYIGNGLFEGQDLRSGQQFKDNNANKGKGGRIGVSIGQGVNVAYSAYEGKYDQNNSRILSLQALDITWIIEGIQILSEFERASLENPEAFAEGKAEGYFVQASFDYETLRPVVAYQRIKYSDEFHGRGFAGSERAGNGIMMEKSRWALGIAYTLAQDLLLKLEYDINRENNSEKKNNVFSLQIALSF